MAEQCALYWLRDLKEKGITPLWATAYESLLSQLPRCSATTQVDEEWEDTAFDNIEGNKGDEDKSGDEDEGDDNVGDDDDYDDFDFDDQLIEIRYIYTTWYWKTACNKSAREVVI